MFDTERSQRIAIFQDTLQLIESKQYLRTAVQAAIKNTVCFYPGNYPKADPVLSDCSAEKATKLSVSQRRSFEAAARLRKTEPHIQVAVLNFANAFHPGGGVQNGASAQEESLCRCSTLFQVLSAQEIYPRFYQYHQDEADFKASDTVLYTPGIVVIKSDTELPERLPEADWFEVDVITAAAPDLRHQSLSDKKLYKLQVRRIIHILCCAASQGADSLVLGAFGCGAFQNNPAIVAKAFKKALTYFSEIFSSIEFAVYCKGEPDNYESFMREFE